MLYSDEFVGIKCIIQHLYQISNYENMILLFDLPFKFYVLGKHKADIT